jgi:hypothetical protein
MTNLGIVTDAARLFTWNDHNIVVVVAALHYWEWWSFGLLVGSLVRQGKGAILRI